MMTHAVRTENRENYTDIRMIDRSSIRTLIQSGTLENCIELFHSYLEQVRFYSLESMMLRLYISMDIYLTARNASAEFGVTNEEFLRCFGSIDDIASRMHTIDTTVSYLEALITQCIRWRIASVAENSSSSIRKARDYIDTHYMCDDISLNKVADEVGLTPTYLSMLFKKETKYNFSDYVTFLRISKAKELLCCTSKLICEIAFEVGFRDYRYFSQIFKKHTGMTPRQFQNRTNLA